MPKKSRPRRCRRHEPDVLAAPLDGVGKSAGQEDELSGTAQHLSIQGALVTNVASIS